MNLKDKDSSIDLLETASSGGSLESIQKYLGPQLGLEADAIFNNLANCEPDFGQYCKLAGQAYEIQKLLTSINVKLDEAREASKELRKIWKVK